MRNCYAKVDVAVESWACARRRASLEDVTMLRASLEEELAQYTSNVRAHWGETYAWSMVFDPGVPCHVCRLKAGMFPSGVKNWPTDIL